MQAELQKNGVIKIIAETAAEGFALRHVVSQTEYQSCGHCGRVDIPVLFDMDILQPTATAEAQQVNK